MTVHMLCFYGSKHSGGLFFSSDNVFFHIKVLHLSLHALSSPLFPSHSLSNIFSCFFFVVVFWSFPPAYWYLIWAAVSRFSVFWYEVVGFFFGSLSTLLKTDLSSAWRLGMYFISFVKLEIYVWAGAFFTGLESWDLI